MQPHPAAAWRPDRLLRGLLYWTAVTTLGFWLPAVRGACDGPSYAWGFFSWNGRGMAGDYWFPLAGVAFALTLQVLGWRGARMPFHVLLLGWHLVLTVGVVYFSLKEDIRFRGDSLGINISLAAIGPVVFGIPLLLAAWWARRDRRRTPHPPVPPWKRLNTLGLAGLLLLLPLQLVLFRGGPPHDPTDQVGVVLTILQWLFVGWALRPYPLRP